ncbi:hypothetical protein ABDJ41_19830 [Pedobacter sp. ASV1-7]|uniref:hypothetical protein n=1 Tax=Pedobacter sp. ASV1-7 TaxID=3145237 RepID=UPI0032E8B9F0
MKNQLFGIAAVGLALAFSAFTNVQKTLTPVEYGVLAEDNDRYQITPSQAAPGHGCASLSIPCTVAFDNVTNPIYQEGLNWYVDKDGTPAHFNEIGSGGYTD